MFKQISVIYLSLIAFVNVPAVMAAGGCSRPVVVAASPLGIFMEIDEQKKVTGIIADFFAEISQSTGCQFVYEVMPRIRALHMLETGKIDLIAASKTPKRDIVADYIGVASARISLISLKERPNSGNILNDLMSGKIRVNVIRGYDLGPKYLELLVQLSASHNLEDVIDADVIAQKIIYQRCDATIMAVSNFFKSAKKYNLESRLLITPIDFLPIYHSGFYVTKKGLPEKDRFFLIDKIISKVKAGRIKELYREKVSKWEEETNSIIFE
ncbi:substrate-binding periplasmic protein [Iodobacter ciconiae]|uniref:Transporter substrate-binding domain-containing protein n=1 Tax=Iodobacter ciconiae TaxID=2496266 RepID=A0A3S8ZNZ6_9NEIS|nr:transporter substrate-binding domain-containing protein [Iodobacter ciconiae]AZN35119.1 transporter substrate-binding domain-containing protein [Iodobacter ciconiae]